MMKWILRLPLPILNNFKQRSTPDDRSTIVTTGTNTQESRGGFTEMAWNRHGRFRYLSNRIQACSLLLGAALLALLCTSRSLGETDLTIATARPPVTVPVTLPSPELLVAGHADHKATHEAFAAAIANRLMQAREEHSRRLLVLDIRNGALSWNGLTAAQQRSVREHNPSEDVMHAYESAVARLLLASFESAESAGRIGPVSVFGLPIELDGPNVQTAGDSNQRYAKVIDTLSAFVTRKSFILLHQGTNEHDAVQRGLRESVRLRDGRPIVFRSNGRWRIAYAEAATASADRTSPTEHEPLNDASAESGEIAPQDNGGDPVSARARERADAARETRQRDSRDGLGGDAERMDRSSPGGISRSPRSDDDTDTRERGGNRDLESPSRGRPGVDNRENEEQARRSNGSTPAPMRSLGAEGWKIGAALGWGDEFLTSPELQELAAHGVERFATVHPWTTAGRDPDGRRRHHIPPDFERTKNRTSYIPPDWSGWIYIDAEPWRSRWADGSHYIWDWDEMLEYYTILSGQFRELFPDAKIVFHGLPTVTLQLTEDERGGGDPVKFGPILALADAVAATAYTSNSNHAVNGGINRLNTLIDRAEAAAEAAGGLDVMMIMASFLATDPRLFWPDDLLRLRADAVWNRGHPILLWGGGGSERPLNALWVIADHARDEWSPDDEIDEDEDSDDDKWPVGRPVQYVDKSDAGRSRNDFRSTDDRTTRRPTRTTQRTSADANRDTAFADTTSGSEYAGWSVGDCDDPSYDPWDNLHDFTGLPMTCDGWTDYSAMVQHPDLYNDTIVVYVSSSTGSDTAGSAHHSNAPVIGGNPFDPSGTISPFRTLHAAYSQLRDGKADIMLLKRGDVWEEGFPQWRLSGKSAQEPLIVGAYGDVAEDRPIVKHFGTSNGADHPGDHFDHVALVNLQFTHDIVRLVGGDGWLIEGVAQLKSPHDGIMMHISGPVEMTNVTVRRTVIADRYTTGSNRRHGASFSNVDGLLIEESVFDRNGWNPDVRGAAPTPLNHNVHIDHTCTDVTFRGNISSRASGAGVQQQPGGMQANNLYLQNPIVRFGYASEPPGSGVPFSGVIRDNVLLDAIDRAGAPAGGLRIEGLDGAVISGNIIAHRTSSTSKRGAIEFGAWGDSFGASNDVQIRNNAVYNWQGGPAVRFEHGRIGHNTVDVHDNRLHQPNSALITMPNDSNMLARITFRSNEYFSRMTHPFEPGGTFAGWQAITGDAMSTYGAISFADPNRNTAAYLATLSLTASTDEAALSLFLSKAKSNRRGHWDPAFTAASVNAYVREGFGLSTGGVQ